MRDINGSLEPLAAAFNSALYIGRNLIDDNFDTRTTLVLFVSWN